MLKLITCSLCVLLLLGCRKDNSLKKEYVGRWEFAQFIGFPGSLTEPPGNGKLLILSDDGRFERIEQGSVVSSGKFSVIRKKDCHPRDGEHMVKAKDGYLDEHYIQIINGRLSLSTSNCLMDGGTVIFRRVE
jgi:hypothetical protein